VFIAFMLVSNWMGSPEFRVQSSAELEISGEIMPEEGPSVMKGTPYDSLVVGTYFPGDPTVDDPHLSRALHEFQLAMERHGCAGPGFSSPYFDLDPCKEVGENAWGNTFTTNAMPNPYAELRISQAQEDMVKFTLYFESEHPDTGELLIQNETHDYRHADSFYEEECRFFNKNC
jgi:hypothetical protein